MFCLFLIVRSPKPNYSIKEGFFVCFVCHVEIPQTNLSIKEVCFFVLLIMLRSPIPIYFIKEGSLLVLFVKVRSPKPQHLWPCSQYYLETFYEYKWGHFVMFWPMVEKVIEYWIILTLKIQWNKINNFMEIRHILDIIQKLNNEHNLISRWLNNILSHVISCQPFHFELKTNKGRRQIRNVWFIF